MERRYIEILPRDHETYTVGLSLILTVWLHLSTKSSEAYPAILDPLKGGARRTSDTKRETYIESSISFTAK